MVTTTCGERLSCVTACPPDPRVLALVSGLLLTIGGRVVISGGLVHWLHGVAPRWDLS